MVNIVNAQLQNGVALLGFQQISTILISKAKLRYGLFKIDKRLKIKQDKTLILSWETRQKSTPSVHYPPVTEQEFEEIAAYRGF